jgi:tryptophan-rich sensory protein
MSSSHQSKRRFLRPAVGLSLALAQPLATQLARWTGRGTTEVEQARQSEGPVTPAGGAFVIWAPLFAGSLACAISDLRRTRAGLATSAAAGWWANAALAGTTAWSLNAQFRRLDRISVALILASASAATTSTALAERHPTEHAASRYIAPLAGWLCVASFANIETTRNLRDERPTPSDTTTRATRTLVAAAATGSAATVVVRGNPLFALTACWGLTGTTVKAVRNRQPLVALTAGAGALGIAISSLLTRRVGARSRR